MSNVIRPSGPLPPRVYWTRRLLVVVAVVALVSLGWWVFGRVTGNAQGRSATAPTTSPVPASVPVSTSAAASTTAPPSRPGGDPGTTPPRRPGGHHGQTRPDPTSHTPPPTPTGACNAKDVDMRVVVSDSKMGEANKVRLLLTSIKSTACTLAITPESLVLRVTSGPDVIWTSDNCPDKLLARALVVTQDSPTSYDFVWDGHRSTDSCRAPGKVARPGGYWVEAALIGADTHKGFFDIT